MKNRSTKGEIYEKNSRILLDRLENKHRDCRSTKYFPTFGKKYRKNRRKCLQNIEWMSCSKLHKGKAIPLQAWTGPEGSRRLRFPDFKTVNTWRWQGCQPYAPAAFTPRKYSRYSFLLEDESTPGPQCGQKDYVNEKFQWHHREANPRPSDL